MDISKKLFVAKNSKWSPYTNLLRELVKVKGTTILIATACRSHKLDAPSGANVSNTIKKKRILVGT